jgi:hypothetical protein
MIYRVHNYSHVNGSEGFFFFARKADAEAHARWYSGEDEENEPTIEKMPTPKSKEEVLTLLREWAGHAENG